MPPGHRVLSVEFKVKLPHPAVSDRFQAEGRVVRSGRTLSVCDLAVHGLAGGQSRQSRASQQTLMGCRQSVPEADLRSKSLKSVS